jgi:hypothetical protein
VGRHSVFDGKRWRRSAGLQPRPGARRFFGVVADKDCFDHKVGLKRRCHRLEKVQLFDGPVSLHAGVDDPIPVRRGVGVQAAFQQFAGVWFGNDDGRPTSKASGSNLPAVAWQRFMTEALAGRTPLPLIRISVSNSDVVKRTRALGFNRYPVSG